MESPPSFTAGQLGNPVEFTMRELADLFKGDRIRLKVGQHRTAPG